MPVQTVIKLRRDTAANWESTNPVLASGEEGYETDTGFRKIGNGTSAWAALPYMATSRIAQTVKNTSGSPMAKGSVVYISSATGGDVSVSLADADTEATSSKTIGLLGEAVANDGFGEVVTEGLLSGVNTASATAGQSVWLSSTAGGFVFNAPPAKPAHSVYLGVVTRVHATEGEILVKVQNGYELEELHNVSIDGSLANKQVIQYDSATSLWKNATISAGAAVGDTPPASPSANDIWWDSVAGRAYIYYDSFWVELSPGMVGPQGPAGADGATGATGATGPEGPAVTSMNASAVVTTVSDKSANYAITSADKNTYIRSTSSAITITVNNVLAIGESVNFIQAGSGQITFAAGAGVTLLSADSLLKTAKQYAGATVTCGASGVYYLIGNLG